MSQKAIKAFPPLFLFILLIMSIFSCSEKKFKCKYNDKDPGLVKAATIKEGSYFIYKDSISGTEDSFYVNRYWIDYFCDPRVEGASAWYINYNMTGNNGYSMQMQATGILQGFADPFGSIRYLYFPFTEGTELGSPYLPDSLFTFKMIRYHPYLQLLDKSYSNVYEIMNRHLTQNRTDTEYVQTFYSIDEGLVKYRTRYQNEDWKVWELSRHHINR